MVLIWKLYFSRRQKQRSRTKSAKGGRGALRNTSSFLRNLTYSRYSATASEVSARSTHSIGNRIYQLIEYKVSSKFTLFNDKCITRRPSTLRWSVVNLINVCSGKLNSSTNERASGCWSAQFKFQIESERKLITPEICGNHTRCFQFQQFLRYQKPDIDILDRHTQSTISLSGSTD